MGSKTILWWGRFDPDYSRNRILRQALRDFGWDVVDFRPLLSSAADLEAALRHLATPTLVWVPCFRHRDVTAAARWAKRRGIPLLFDPLISSYDKQVFERRKHGPDSHGARRLRARERKQLRCADLLVADTDAHADLFRDLLADAPSAPMPRIHVVPVGAEEALFHPQPATAPSTPVHVLFYGSFIPLQGPQVIVEAARQCRDADVHWHFVGDGPLRKDCESLAAGLPNVSFEDWLPYADLPARIHRADIVLGVFGDTDKAGRVIPNKVYQALACGKPVVTRTATAYPAALRAGAQGITWVPPGDPFALAQAMRQLAASPARLDAEGQAGYRSYRSHFSQAAVRDALEALLRQAVA